MTMNAQLSQGLIAKVPFDFVAGYKSFPAGEYRVASQSPSVLAVRSLDGKTTGFVLSQRTESVVPPTYSRLVFNKYGDKYFLSQIWAEGITSGAELRKTPTELKASARNTGAVTRTSVIASKGSR